MDSEHGEYEIDPEELKKLEGDEASFFIATESIITDPSLGKRRLTVFSYLSIRKGMDGKSLFTLGDMIEWARRKPDPRNRGINDSFKETIGSLEKAGYMQLSGKLTTKGLSVAVVNESRINEEGDREYFAIIYLDELKKILEYINPNQQDKKMSNETVLLVFAYLRMKIRRRLNKFLPGEAVTDENSYTDRKATIKKRRERYPDAYDCYYKDIAEDVGISERAASDAVEVLNDLGLIYSLALSRMLLDDGKWHTPQTVFCNRYKREKGYLVEGGKGYYEREAESKKKHVEEFYRQYLKQASQTSE